MMNDGMMNDEWVMIFKKCGLTLWSATFNHAVFVRFAAKIN
jgi:hypothetical protein